MRRVCWASRWGLWWLVLANRRRQDDIYYCIVRGRLPRSNTASGKCVIDQILHPRRGHVFFFSRLPAANNKRQGWLHVVARPGTDREELLPNGNPNGHLHDGRGTGLLLACRPTAHSQPLTMELLLLLPPPPTHPSLRPSSPFVPTEIELHITPDWRSTGRCGFPLLVIRWWWWLWLHCRRATALGPHC